MGNRKTRHGAKVQSNISPRTRLTPANWDQFYKLLLTWPLRQAAGKEIIPPPEEEQPENWKLELEYEEKYGEKREGREYVKRKQDMVRVLSRLDRKGRADLQRVYDILCDARQTAMSAFREGQGIDWNRPRGEQADHMMSDLSASLGELRYLYESCGYDGPDPGKVTPPEANHALLLLSALAEGKTQPRPGWPQKWPELACVVMVLDAILKGIPVPLALANALSSAVEDDALLKYVTAAPRRRVRAGGQATPWVQTAWHDLYEAGVHLRQDRTDLLVAVGLKEFKD